MAINQNLPLNKCWDMVNRIQLADSPNEIRERCGIAIKWLQANKVISDDDYDDLMDAVMYLMRESYHMTDTYCNA